MLQKGPGRVTALPKGFLVAFFFGLDFDLILPPLVFLKPRGRVLNPATV